MTDPDLLRDLLAAGVAPELVARVAKLAAKVENDDARRQKNRERMQGVRARARTLQHVHEHDARAAQPSAKECPQTPIENTTSSPIANAIGSEADVVGEDPKARLFRIGKTALASWGIAEKRTGSLIGQWLKARNDPVGLLAAIQFARDQNVADPVAYVSTLVHGKGKPNGHKSHNLADLASELADEARERERAAGIGRPDAPFGSA